MLSNQAKPTPERVLGSWNERLVTSWFVLIAAITPLIALLAPLGLTPLAAITLLVVLVGSWNQRPWRWLPTAPALLIVGIMVYGMVSTFWAIDKLQTVTTSLRVGIVSLASLGMVVIARRFPWRKRHLIFYALLVGFSLTALLLLWEYLDDRGLSHFIAALKGTSVVGNKSPLNRGATIFALLVWPLILMIQRRWGNAAGLICGLSALTVIFLGDSGSAKLSSACGFVACGLSWFAPRFAFPAIRYAILGIVVSLPIAASLLPPPQESFDHWRWVPLSVHHRLTIWTFTGERIAEKPVLGWGMDASRSIPGGDDEIRVTRYPRSEHEEQVSLLEALLPLHPHNAVLQWWLELGLTGTALLFAFLYTVIQRFERSGLSVAQRGTVMGLLTTGFLVSLNSFGFWQNWWQAGLWLAATMWAIAASDPET